MDMTLRTAFALVTATVAALIVMFSQMVGFRDAGAPSARAHNPAGTEIHKSGRTATIQLGNGTSIKLRLRRADDLKSARVSHFVPWTYVVDDIKATNAGGWCGEGAYWRCVGYWVIGLYYGGDGNPQVGSHSLQFDIRFLEKHNVTQTARNCRIIERWYHESFGEAYKGAAGGTGYRYCY